MTSQREYQYTLLGKAEARELLEIYRSLYPGLGWTEEYMRWQYFDNPAGPARIWAAKHDGRIAASYAAIPHRLHQNGSTALSWRVQDVLTLEEHRGQGLYHQLASRAAKDLFTPEYPLNFTFPNDKSKNGFIRNGWTAPFRLPLKVKSPLDFPRFPAPQARELSAFGLEEEAIWAAARRRLGFGVERSAAYLNWRYFANPKSKYRAFRLDSLVLVLKLYKREDGVLCSHLVDLFQAEADGELARRAFAHWVGFSLDHGCGFMSCWSAKGSDLEPSLTEAGFGPQPGFDRWMVLDPNPVDRFSKAAKRPEDESSWHLVMGDSDVF
jgi:hypothetical protein